MTWSCLDGGLLSHLLGAFWPFRTDGFWWCMGLPWHYKMANQLFFKQTPLQITDLERGGAKNASTKSQTWGGCKKIKTTPLQNHKPGGGGVRTTTSPTSTFLGSPLGSFWVLFYQFLFSSHTSNINQNDRTRIFKFIPNQPNINQFSLQNQGSLHNDRTRGI